MAARVVYDSDDSAEDLSDCATSIDPLQDDSVDPFASGANATIEHPEASTIYPTPSVSNGWNNHSLPHNNLKRSRTIHGLEGLHTAETNDGKSLKRRKTASPGTAASWRHNQKLVQNENERDIFEFDDTSPDISKSDQPLKGVADETEIELDRGEYLGTENSNTFDDSVLEDVNTSTSKATVYPNLERAYVNHETGGLPNGSPTRSKSMHIPIDSPHDTQIMSSRTLAHARRGLTMGSQAPQSSACSIDELALPASIEVAVPPPAPGAFDSSFTADPKGPTSTEYSSDEFGGMPKEMYVPRPTRSRQRSKAEPSNDDINTSRRNTDTHDEEMSPISAGDENEPYSTSHSIPKQQNEHLPQEIPQSNVQQIHQPEPPEGIELVEVPEKPKRARKNTKKKLKRGKTASVLIRKTVESDVEDDVIWVDERPLIPASGNITTNPNQHPPVHQPEEDDHLGETLKVEVNISGGDETKMNAQTENASHTETEPPAPKKRGRKRKKTADPTETISEPMISPSVQKQLPEPAEIDIVEAAQSHLQPHTDDGSGIAHTDTNHDTRQQDGAKRKETLEPVETSPQSPAKRDTIEEPQFETPKRNTAANDSPGPTKHSPIAITNKVGFRVGLSRKARIAPLLKIVRK